MRLRRFILAAALAMLLGVASASFAQSPPTPHTVGDLIGIRYGVPNAIVQHKVVTVGTTPVQLTPGDATRFADVFSDVGTSSCTLAHSNQVSTSLGFPLAIDGVISETWRDDMVLPTYEMWAVCAASGVTIDVLELKLP